MVREAIDAIGPRTTNVAIRDWIQKKYRGTNAGTISCSIITCTVNHDTRVYYYPNVRPRAAITEYEFLYRCGRGQLEFYDPTRHGAWVIEESEGGRLRVRKVDTVPGEAIESPLESGGDFKSGSRGQHALDTERGEDDAHVQFALESHLRDYVARNLGLIENGLELYVDEETDSAGVEFVTPLGRIDILAVDTDAGFVVVELKVSRGSDVVFGQIASYMAWVERHLAKGKRVRGFIIANSITENLRYAASRDSSVCLMEYELEFRLNRAADKPEAGP
ncbi:MAG: DUF91 domain-containing protein [Phycisphaerales bacterium]|nr:DUF91 domain-containing protein [Phycisphaerales bacterium]